MGSALVVYTLEAVVVGAAPISIKSIKKYWGSTKFTKKSKKRV